MIRAVSLTKSYGSFHALRGVSFDIPPGEIVGLLGPNGAGKTTTMRILATALRPSSGTAEIAGFDIHQSAHDIRMRLGYLPEVPPLYPEMRVNEYLSFCCKLRGVPREKEHERIAAAVEQCSLSQVTKKLCSALSRGFRQRVGIAQALIHQPDVVILDEPTIGLDPAQILEVRNLIRSLAGKFTVMLSTHMLREVEEICSRVVILAGGKVRASGSLQEFKREQSLEHAFLAATEEVA